MNQRDAVKRRGWEIYRDSGGNLTREELNSQLRALGLGRVSIRMFDHYGRLNRHGCFEYMPMNELDIRVKLSRSEKRAS